MAAPFDLTLSQAVTVADAIECGKAALETAIMDSTDGAAVIAMQAIHGELYAHQRDLRNLIEAARPATLNECDERRAFLIRQALGNGESFDVIAGIAAEAHRQERALAPVVQPAGSA